MDIGNLPEKEFRIMIVKMIQDLGIRMEANSLQSKGAVTVEDYWTECQYYDIV